MLENKKEKKIEEKKEKNMKVQLTRKLKEESVRFWVRKSTNHARPPR